MTIATYDPNTTQDINIGFTQRALSRAETLVAEKGAKGLRLTIDSGCSGYLYQLDFTNTPADDDLRTDISDKLTLFVAADAHDLVKGTEIDFLEDKDKSGFQFNNPNATGECGCGESFSIT